MEKIIIKIKFMKPKKKKKRMTATFNTTYSSSSTF